MSHSFFLLALWVLFGLYFKVMIVLWQCKPYLVAKNVHTWWCISVNFIPRYGIWHFIQKCYDNRHLCYEISSQADLVSFWIVTHSITNVFSNNRPATLNVFFGKNKANLLRTIVWPPHLSEQDFMIILVSFSELWFISD